MKIDVLTLGPVQTNCYVVSMGNSCVIIDPADRADRILDHLKRNGLECKGLLLTHGHFDHICGVDSLCQELGVKCYIHDNDAIMLENAVFNASANFGFNKTLKTHPDVFYGSYCKLLIDCFEIEAFNTPGHSKGSVCYKIGDCIFCGDLLFSTSCGRTDLYGGSSSDIIASIKKVVADFDDGTVIYPGHDREFTLSYAKENNYIIRDYVLKSR